LPRVLRHVDQQRSLEKTSLCDNGRVSKEEPGRFRFGLFEFDASTGELRREGALVRLPPQPTQLLLYLLVHAGKALSREELRIAVWGDTTFVDFDRGLNFCISQIRSALRDDSAEPRYIRTMPKQGYQFISPVERINGTASAPAGTTPAAPSRFRTLRIAMAALAVPFLLGLGLLAGYWPKSAVRGRVPIVAVARFDNETHNSEVDRVSDGLTDSVVEQLTSASQGRYDVIGNAQILRLPREQRDLSAIGGSLHATYVILGQVQSNGTTLRILAHLIHMPEQTHVWVVRMDVAVRDQLELESQVAQKITLEFSRRVADGDTAPLHSSTMR
jgi:DNA-binding winged helix-turn-helix (wHTH) protein/TolB-like protein